MDFVNNSEIHKSTIRITRIIRNVETSLIGSKRSSSIW